MPWLKLAGAAALVGLVLWFGHWNREAGRREVLADWTASQLAAESAVRELEHTWQGRVVTARAEADVKLQEVTVNAGRVAANTDRLHVAALTAAKRGACKNATAAQGKRDSGLLLADVLNRVGKRTGDLAAYADRLRIEAEECRAAWPK